MKNCYFAGGCFWCIESVFSYINGVKDVVNGYSGGNKDNPTYEEVKSQLTNHRETIRITYDEKEISFTDLLKVFLENVDPFDDGGQFIDRGFSYTLAIFYQDDNEYQESIKLIEELEKKTNKKVYISLVKFDKFYLAEEEHQDYYLKNKEEFEEELIKSGRKK